MMSIKGVFHFISVFLREISNITEIVDPHDAIFVKNIIMIVVIIPVRMETKAAVLRSLLFLINIKSNKMLIIKVSKKMFSLTNPIIPEGGLGEDRLHP